MRKQIITHVWLIAVLLCWQMSALAQVETETKEGLRKTTFTTDRGEVSVYLPNMLKKGDRISGTVMAEPAGKNDRQWEKNKAALKGYVMEVQEAPDNTATIDKDFFNWIIPTAISGGVLHFVLKDEKGKTVAIEEMSVAEQGPAALLSDKLTIPRAIVEGSLVPSRSHVYDGDLMNTRIKVGDRPAFILAESPREAFFVCPEDILGPLTVLVVEGNEVQKATTNVLSIDMMADKTTFSRGEKSEITIVVKGLDGMSVPVPLNVVNESPGIVSLSGGDDQTITIYPGQVDELGIYQHAFTVYARHNGAYEIYADITMNPPLGDISMCPIIPEELLVPPPTPEGYVYVGREVVVGYAYVEELSTVPLDRENEPDDIVFINSRTETVEGNIVCEYMVSHVFAKRSVNE